MKVSPPQAGSVPWASAFPRPAKIGQGTWGGRRRLYKGAGQKEGCWKGRGRKRVPCTRSLHSTCRLSHPPFQGPSRKHQQRGDLTLHRHVAECFSQITPAGEMCILGVRMRAVSLGEGSSLARGAHTKAPSAPGLPSHVSPGHQMHQG